MNIYLPHRRLAFSSAVNNYTAYATGFGNGPYMYRTSDLVGNANSSQVTISLWFKFLGGNLVNQYLLESYSGDYYRFSIMRGSDGKMYVIGYSINGNLTVNFQGSTTYFSGSGWHHILISIDTSTVFNNAFIYIDDIQVSNSCNYKEQLQLTGQHSVANNVFNATQPMWGELCEIWSKNVFYDLTVTANRRLFNDGGSPLRPVAAPSGALLYLKDPYTSFSNNSGTGGNFTTSGVLTQGTPP